MASRLRAIARDAAIRILSAGQRIDATRGWVRIPYYHHVFEHERAGFARQLDYLRRFGEFLSLDDALGLIDGTTPIDGRYFCVGFDDGFKSCATGAFPILAERQIPATFYVVTEMVGRSLSADNAIARDVFGADGRTPIDFMSWDDCRALAAGGMTIGSHTRHHARLADLSADQAIAEMTDSKNDIEHELGITCRHFCAPYGLPGRDFDADRDTGLAREAGFTSFATGSRGPNRPSGSGFALRRDHVLANWGLHQLRYFLSSD